MADSYAQNSAYDNDETEEKETSDSDTSQSDNKEKSESKKISDEDLLALARKCFQIAEEAESENRVKELDDLNFMVGEQWDINIKQQRQSDNRPCLTINLLPQYVRDVTNEQRQNRPSIKINPVDDKADVETAKIFQGIVRHIEYNSHADIAYDTAFEQAAKGGLGYFRLTTEFAHEMSFQQEIKIKRIKDRMSVYVDPYYQEPDGSDMEWGFIFENMSPEEFQAQYPDAKLTGMKDWEGLGKSSESWITDKSVRVAEYYYKIYERAEICLLSNQSVIEKSKLPATLPDGIKVVETRTTLMPKIKWAKINGIEVLEKTDIPGKWIPIIPVIGQEEIVDGKRIISGIIRNAKDPQRMYNYWKSSQTETIALAPRAPFIGVEGQFEGYEEKWKTANIRNHAYLEYKPKSIAGVPAPAPQRNAFEPPVQAISQASAEAAQDLKSTTGIYDAALGKPSNEQSGVAIQRRSMQSQTANFHFVDNLSRSLRHAGRIMINWIPQVYDTAQSIRVISEDGEVTMQKINQMFKEGGKDKTVLLDEGIYDATVDTGPSYQTKRQEAVASMLDLVRSLPQVGQAMMDLIVRNMDWPGAKEIADRLKKLLPPQLADDNKDQAPLPPQVQQQLAQYQKMVQDMSKMLEEDAQIIKGKKLELESAERIAALKAENDLKMEVIKHDAKDAQLMFETEIERINQRLQLLHIDQPIMPDSGGQPAANPSEQPQQPTGGLPPGQPMGGEQP